jgi:hypothetical protein
MIEYVTMPEQVRKVLVPVLIDAHRRALSPIAGQDAPLVAECARLMEACAIVAFVEDTDFRMSEILALLRECRGGRRMLGEFESALYRMDFSAIKTENTVGAALSGAFSMAKIAKGLN